MARIRKRADTPETPPPASASTPVSNGSGSGSSSGSSSGNANGAESGRAKRGPKPKSAAEKAKKRQHTLRVESGIAAHALNNPITPPTVTADDLNAAVAVQDEIRLSPALMKPWFGRLPKNEEEIRQVQESMTNLYARSQHIAKENELPTHKRGTKPSILSKEEIVNFLTLLRAGFGKTSACYNLGFSTLRLNRTRMLDPIFAAQVRTVEESCIDDCMAFLYQTAMTPGHDAQITAAINFITLARRDQQCNRTYLIKKMDLELRRQVLQEKIQGAAVEDRIDYKRLSPDERDEYDYLSEKLHVDQEFTAEEALAYVRITRKLVQSAPTTATGDVAQQGGGGGAMRQLELDPSDDTD